MRKTLFTQLKEYGTSSMIPFHMPGHKRNPLYGYSEDITEIEGFDDLHHPQSSLKEIMNLGAKLWGSDTCFLLINGSTCGILSGIRGATKRYDKVLVARNCHKSVYHGIELCGLTPIYIYPPMDEETGIFGSVTPQSIEDALKKDRDITLVILTSPTYEGVLSDIKGVSAIAHEYGVPVLVDQAHGAHLGFSPYFLGSAVKSGADIVVQSLHKTMTGMTQTALCHVNGTLVNSKRIMRELNVFETSSPSYVLMASIDQCFALLEEKKDDLFSEWQESLSLFSEKIKDLKVLTVLCKGRDKRENHPDFFQIDPSKIVVFVNHGKITGTELSDILREQYKIELEMAAKDYVIALSGLGDCKENFIALAEALLAIDKTLRTTQNTEEKISLPHLKKAYDSYEIIEKEVVFSAWQNALHCVSGSYLWAYPPGIPLIVPGEIIDSHLLKMVEAFLFANVNLIGTHGDPKEGIGVLKT